MDDNLKYIKRHKRFYGINCIIFLLVIIQFHIACVEERRKRLNSLKTAINENQITADLCKKFIDEMDNLKIDEIREVEKLIAARINESKGNEQKIRCEQTLALVDQLTICNDSIWIHYYRLIIYWCFEKSRYHFDIAQRKKIWLKAKEKYWQIINLQKWKNGDYPDRIWIISDFAHLCFCNYSSIDSESIDWIQQLIYRSEMKQELCDKSKMMLERSRMHLEMCKLRRESLPSREKVSIHGSKNINL
jgi:hypothetical protein